MRTLPEAPADVTAALGHRYPEPARALRLAASELQKAGTDAIEETAVLHPSLAGAV